MVYRLTILTGSFSITVLGDRSLQDVLALWESGAVTGKLKAVGWEDDAARSPLTACIDPETIMAITLTTE